MKTALLLFISMLLYNAEAGLVDDFVKKALNQVRPLLKDLYINNMSLPNLTLKNVIIEGLDEFETTGLSVQLLPLKIKNLTIEIPNVQMDGVYRMQGLQMPGPITLDGAGDVSGHITGIVLYTSAKLTSVSLKLIITEIEQISLYVDTLDLQLTGLAGGGPVGKLLSDIIRIVAKPIVNLMATPLLMENREILKENLNKILAQLDI